MKLIVGLITLKSSLLNIIKIVLCFFSVKMSSIHHIQTAHLFCLILIGKTCSRTKQKHNILLIHRLFYQSLTFALLPLPLRHGTVVTKGRAI